MPRLLKQVWIDINQEYRHSRLGSAWKDQISELFYSIVCSNSTHYAYGRGASCLYKLPSPLYEISRILTNGAINASQHLCLTLCWHSMDIPKVEASSTSSTVSILCPACFDAEQSAVLGNPSGVASLQLPLAQEHPIHDGRTST